MSREQVTFMVDKENDRKLEIVAAVEGRTKSDLLADAFEYLFKTRGYLKDLPFVKDTTNDISKRNK